MPNAAALDEVEASGVEPIAALDRMNRDQSDPMLGSWINDSAVDASGSILSGT